MPYSSVWDETTPAGTEARSLGDDRIRELKTQIRERLLSYNSSIGDYDGVIPSGTKMLFYQDTAPVGWTIQNTLDDKLVYITKGSAAGGQTGGTAHSTGSWTITGFGGRTDLHTLSIDQIPPHTHTYTKPYQAVGAGVGDRIVHATTDQTGSTGGGQPHSHNISSNLTHNGAWRPAAYCCIICQKD